MINDNSMINGGWLFYYQWLMVIVYDQWSKVSNILGMKDQQTVISNELIIITSA